MSQLKRGKLALTAPSPSSSGSRGAMGEAHLHWRGGLLYSVYCSKC